MTTPLIPTQETSSTYKLLEALRRAMVNYSPDGERHISDVLGTEPDTRLFITRAPDNGKFPYGTIRLESQNSGRYHLMRLVGSLEVLLYGRPWTQQENIENCADMIEQAMYEMILNSDGLVFCQSKQRATVPPGPDPVDSEVCTVRLLFTLVIWPAYLTRLTVVLPPE